MVHNDWVWVWVQTVANGFAGAVANGSQQLGLRLGSDRREWFCQSRREWFATIGFGQSQMVLPESSRMVRNDWVGFGFGLLRMVLLETSQMVHNDWVSATVWEVISDGLGVIDDRLGFYR